MIEVSIWGNCCPFAILLVGNKTKSKGENEITKSLACGELVC
jgi:hypothetical protein